MSLSFRPLDPREPVARTRRNLPHWRQGGCLYYVTFRLADSLPLSLLKQWQEERALWMKLNPRPWTVRVVREYARRFQGPVEKWLDAGHGSCALRDRARREVVAGALRFFDGERYALDAYVVMPNHVHVLVRPDDDGDTERPACAAPEVRQPAQPGRAVSLSESDTARPACEEARGIHESPQLRDAAQAGRSVSLSGILHSWKSWTSHQLVKHHGMRSPFWMDESFNHIVRSEEQRLHFRNYIRENPDKAHLSPSEWTRWESESDTGVPPVLP